MRNSGIASGSSAGVGAAGSIPMAIGGSIKKNITTASFTSTPTQRTGSSSSNDQVSPFVLDYGGGDETQEECPAANNNSSAIKNKDLAFTIVWSPLPPITWLIPFIGHTGIADSQGVVSDFRGTYYVGDDGRMAFGAPTRVLRILPVSTGSSSSSSISREQWDTTIRDEANAEYRQRRHNLCWDNCHSHVAYALNHMNVTAYGVHKHNMVTICFLVFFRGRFLSWGGCVKQFLPFILIVALCFLIRKA